MFALDHLSYLLDSYLQLFNINNYHAACEKTASTPPEVFSFNVVSRSLHIGDPVNGRFSWSLICDTP